MEKKNANMIMVLNPVDKVKLKEGKEKGKMKRE